MELFVMQLVAVAALVLSYISQELLWATLTYY